MKRDCRRSRHRSKICTSAAATAKGSMSKMKNMRKNSRALNTHRTWDIFPALMNAPARVHFTLFYSDGHVNKTRLQSCDVR